MGEEESRGESTKTFNKLGRGKKGPQGISTCIKTEEKVKELLRQRR